MGFLRKALFVYTGGASGLVVKANSKKERIAKATEQQVKLQKKMLAATQAPLARQQQPARRSAVLGSAFPTPYSVLDGFVRPRPLPPSETNAFDVVLQRVDPDHAVQTVEFLRRLTELPPRACVSLASTVPVVVAQRLSWADAHQLASRFDDCFAGVEVRKSAAGTAPDGLARQPRASEPENPAPVRDLHISGELQRLADLHERGVLDDQEFTLAKMRILKLD